MVTTTINGERNGNRDRDCGRASSTGHICFECIRAHRREPRQFGKLDGDSDCEQWICGNGNAYVRVDDISNRGFGPSNLCRGFG